MKFLNTTAATVLITSITSITAWCSETVVNWPASFSLIGGGMSFELGTLSTGNNVEIYRNLNFGQTPFLMSGASRDEGAVIYSGISLYGAVEYTNSNGSFSSYARLKSDPTLVEFGEQSIEGSDTGLRGLLVFAKDDFTDAPNSTVSLDSQSSLSVNVNWHNADELICRVAILSEGSWYLSETSHMDSAESGNTYSFTQSDLEAEMFGMWDPGNTGPIPEIPGNFNVQGTSLTNIEAIGYYFDHFRAAANSWLDIDSVEISALVESGGSTEMNWAKWVVDENGFVDTGTFMGWLWVGAKPWVFSYQLEKFIYLPESNVSASGAWVYLPNY